MPLQVVFINNSGVDKSNVSIGLVSGKGTGALPLNVTSASGEALKAIDDSGAFPFAGNWYSLNDLSDGIEINSFSGRIYVCYGDTWKVSRSGYEPAQAVTDDNFFLRYDKMEITYSGLASDVADLTSIDYWSIPMSLKTAKDGVQVQLSSGFINGTTAQSMYDALSALTTPPVSGLDGPGGTDGTPLPAVVPGEFTQYPGGPAPTTNFARIIGPSSYPPSFPTPGGIPVTPYDTMSAYLEHLQTEFGQDTEKNEEGLGKGVFAFIKGSFKGVGPAVPPSGPQAAQDYDLTAEIGYSGDDLMVRLVGNADSVGAITMLYTAEDIKNATGFYGGNAPFKLNGASSKIAPANDVYGWAAADLFAGMNIGAVGSATEIQGQTVRSMESKDWFTEIPSGQFFSGLQPSKPFYNQWAATLAKHSDAYNFAYTDRFAANVQVGLNPAKVDMLEIILDKTDINMS